MSERDSESQREKDLRLRDMLMPCLGGRDRARMGVKVYLSVI
uniref:Uncharacterized protein n=1 Tax=Rhizophora mucronata TaxID=61149 RepID=A0A2P2NUJ0_RHIMU